MTDKSGLPGSGLGTGSGQERGPGTGTAICNHGRCKKRGAGRLDPGHCLARVGIPTRLRAHQAVGFPGTAFTDNQEKVFK